MFNQAFVDMKLYEFIERLKKLCWKKTWFLDMNVKKNHSFLNTRPEHQDHEDARDAINKFRATICNEECIYFEPVFYVLFFDAAFISNKPYFIILKFDQLLE